MAGKENIRTCLFCGCGGWAAFLYDRTVPKIGAAFPNSRHIFITGSVYNSAAIYSFQKGRCGYSHIPCHLNHIGEGAVGRWKMVGSTKH